ncbi:hypothetical protein AAMO2058_000605900 [Amorphochlora amoebiformis]
MADPPDPQLLLAGDPAAITGESEELRHEDLDLKSGNVKERGYHGDWKREAKNYRVLQENLDGFETLCVANGCNPADARSIEKLEVFMTNYPVMSGLERFVSVAHMEIQHQPIEEIRGLDAMPLLVELLINHTRVHRIQGLDKNLKLEKLSLDFNRITVLENLDHLRCLKTLSVSCNQIERIENLQGLSSLTHLNLAGVPTKAMPKPLLMPVPTLPSLILHSECFIKYFIQALLNPTNIFFTAQYNSDMTQTSIRILTYAVGMLSQSVTTLYASRFSCLTRPYVCVHTSGRHSLTAVILMQNRIRSVDRTLEGLSTLRILNLAGNLISSFQEIHHLKRLEG